MPMPMNKPRAEWSEEAEARKVQYILTPKGFSEKMRKSVKYTMKTINSIGLIKNRVKEVMLELYNDGVREFHYFGNPDIRILVEMIFRGEFAEDCSFFVQSEIPQEKIMGACWFAKKALVRIVLICIIMLTW